MVGREEEKGEGGIGRGCEEEYSTTERRESDERKETGKKKSK